jgi:hypothetical protein
VYARSARAKDSDDDDMEVARVACAEACVCGWACVCACGSELARSGRDPEAPSKLEVGRGVTESGFPSLGRTAGLAVGPATGSTDGVRPRNSPRCEASWALAFAAVFKRAGPASSPPPPVPTRWALWDEDPAPGPLGGGVLDCSGLSPKREYATTCTPSPRERVGRSAPTEPCGRTTERWSFVAGSRLAWPP